MAHSMLDPPCLGWERDLPAPNDPPGTLEDFGDPPNHIGEIFIEFPRSSLASRGVLVLVGFCALLVGAFSLLWLAFSPSTHLGLMLLGMSIMAISVWLGATLVKTDLSPPLDEPIRFNRLRRKVYVYRFHYCWWRPFNNKLWYVKPEVFDWDDLRAEVYRWNCTRIAPPTRRCQVHLHRPASCGGIVTLPWQATGSAATLPADDHLSMGMRLPLTWLPFHTGLPHTEMAVVGRMGQGGSELRDEWEFIRRYMEEGPLAVPCPRLTSHFPWPWQAFVAQFEGLSNFIRTSGPLMKLAMVMISPAFLIIGTAHWLSLLLCWKPRWPKVIREAGQPGKPIPKLTTIDDYPPDIRERLLANADRWAVRPGQRSDKRCRAPDAE